jgi:hypothetical protein
MSCLGSCAASLTCSALSMCCCKCGASSAISRRAAKAAYLFVILSSSVVALALYNYGDRISWSSLPYVGAVCNPQGAVAGQCFGASAVVRISLACTLFFTANLLFAFAGDAFVGWWGPKLLLWAAAMVGMFFVPMEVVQSYLQVSRAFSILFLLAMVILIIDFAYTAQEWFGHKMDAVDDRLSATYEEVGLCQNPWRLGYLAAAVGTVGASLAGIIALYVWSDAQRPQVCNTNLAFLSVTLVTGVIYLIISPLECTGGRGILAPSLVFAYSVWLCWSALHTNPDAACNPMPPEANNTGSNIVGMLVAAGSLCYTTFSATRSLPTLFSAAPRKASVASVEQPIIAAGAGAGSVGSPPVIGAGKRVDEESAADGAASSYGSSRNGRGSAADAAPPVDAHNTPDSVLFMLVMVLAAFYMAPVLTNWVSDINNVQSSRLSAVSMWVQISTQWVTIGLYMWTLVAPAVCPGRDFS